LKLTCFFKIGCHTDVHAIDGDWPVKPKMPLCIGHEGAGIIAEIGDNVHDVKIGDHVGVAWLYSACGNCEFCNTGRETLCLSQQNSGYGVDGTVSEYQIAKASHVIPLDNSLDFIQVARKFYLYLKTTFNQNH